MKYKYAKNRWITDELDYVVQQLEKLQCVGIFQGASELGPRALGNRSLLYNPLDFYAKDIMNTIKKREEFRPFAGSIMLEHADTWFDMCGLKESPWMTYAIPSKEIAKIRIPSIIHVDGSCRIQTVTEEQNEHYYNLIKSFHELMLERGEEGDAEYGCPIIFNTSFNLKGAAIVETLDDAMDTCVEGSINILYVPAWEDDGLTLPDEWIEPEETDDDVKDSVKLKTLPTHLTK